MHMEALPARVEGLLHSRSHKTPLAGTLAHVAEVLAPGGFLCFYDFMDVTPAMFWGLSKQCWGHTDEREYSLWCSFGRWERLLADAGFQQARGP